MTDVPAELPEGFDALYKMSSVYAKHLQQIADEAFTWQHTHQQDLEGSSLEQATRNPYCRELVSTVGELTKVQMKALLLFMFTMNAEKQGASGEVLQ